MKLGAATSTNFMKNQSSVGNQHYNMSMLRSVQQNMPNMPNVSTIQFQSQVKQESDDFNPYGETKGASNEATRNNQTARTGEIKKTNNLFASASTLTQLDKIKKI